jgi:hypothetical protein
LKYLSRIYSLVPTHFTAECQNLLSGAHTLWRFLPDRKSKSDVYTTLHKYMIVIGFLIFVVKM